MADTAYPYGAGILALSTSNLDFTGDDIRVALLDSGYTPDQDGDETWDDISEHELATAGGYTAEGALLSGKSVTYDAASNQVRLVADDVEWDESSIGPASFAVVYLDSGSPATSTLLSYVVLDPARTSEDAMFAIRWDGGTDGSGGRVLVGTLADPA